MVTVIQDVREMQRASGQLRMTGKRLAVVPTMGYLHEGHLSLIRLAKQHADLVITTIFVNPTQFGPGEDFERYPRNLPQDTRLAAEAGTDYIFAPEATSMYPEGYRTYVNVEQFDRMLEGKSRPGHFRGVATVVAKLFATTKPHVAVFGQKDAQQVVVIQQMVRDLNFDIEIVVGPIIREADGLAMSSRNAYLEPDQRKEAVVLYKALQLAQERIQVGQKDAARIIRDMNDLITSRSSGKVDYISIANGRTLEELATCDKQRPLQVSLAVRFGTSRLIDNIFITD